MDIDERTELQWLEAGYIVNDGVHGDRHYTNSYHQGVATYFNADQVHEDKEGAKMILKVRAKKLRDKRKMIKVRQGEYLKIRDSMKTKYQWLFDEGRLPKDSAEWKPGSALNKYYHVLCGFGENSCYCHLDDTYLPSCKQELDAAREDYYKHYKF